MRPTWLPFWGTRQRQEIKCCPKRRFKDLFKISLTGQHGTWDLGDRCYNRTFRGWGRFNETLESNRHQEEDLRRNVRRTRLAKPRPPPTIPVSPAHNFSGVGLVFTAISITATRREKYNKESGVRSRCSDACGCRRRMYPNITHLSAVRNWSIALVFWQVKLPDAINQVDAGCIPQAWNVKQIYLQGYQRVS